MRRPGLSLCGLVLGLVVVAPEASAETNAPGGMSRFTAAVGGLQVRSRTNWVRLAPRPAGAATGSAAGP